MSRRRILWTGLAVALVVIALDQLSKQLILSGLEHTIAVTGFFNLVLVFNPGASFGLFAGHPDYARIGFTAIALLAAIALVIWLARARERWLAWPLGAILGGALGNTIDRVRFGAVVDFLDFHVAGYHWPAFNVADSAICVGAFALIVESLIRSRAETPSHDRT
ncbi:MAG: signal peptidase II [Geminicoccaceae bacterium]